MKMKTVLIWLIFLLFLAMSGIVVYLLSQTVVEEKNPVLSSFSVLETGGAGNYSYAVYNYRGQGNLTVLSYPQEPKHSIVIINDSQAIEATRLQELIDSLRILEDYGYNVTVSEEPKIGDGIYVIPTGAIPSYALFNLQSNSSNGTIVYIGARDLLFSNGIKELNWYDSLKGPQKNRVVQYNGTLDQFLENGSVSLEREILLSSWMAQNSTKYSISGDGIRTAAVPFNASGYMRIIYEFSDLQGIFDSPHIETSSQSLAPVPESIYPWERSSLKFFLNRTNGTAFFTVKKDGKVKQHEQLRRVTDENVFLERFEYQDPGEYILLAEDNSGVIASGLLHVKDLRVNVTDISGYTIIFSVMVDGAPLDGTEAFVSLGNSSKKKYFVSGGSMIVMAKLNKGQNDFIVELNGADIPVTVMNNQSTVFEFYINYGLPVFAVVALVYFGARITRVPTYRLRFGDSADYVRTEIAIPADRAVESFLRIRKDMLLGKTPITPQEFSISLKRYLTNGADVTEGNVEEILTKLVRAGRLETHRDYYQLKGEGDAKRNVLGRMIREKLIESGTQFKEAGGKFVTKDYEIGFFGQEFGKKGIIVVDDLAEERMILERLSDAERAKLRLMQSNGMISFVTIDRLTDVL